MPIVTFDVTALWRLLIEQVEKTSPDMLFFLNDCVYQEQRLNKEAGVDSSALYAKASVLYHLATKNLTSPDYAQMVKMRQSLSRAILIALAVPLDVTDIKPHVEALEDIISHG